MWGNTHVSIERTGSTGGVQIGTYIRAAGVTTGGNWGYGERYSRCWTGTATFEERLRANNFRSGRSRTVGAVCGFESRYLQAHVVRDAAIHAKLTGVFNRQFRPPVWRGLDFRGPMTERQAFNIAVRKIEIMERDNWTCQVCGAPATQLAHRIPQSRMNIRRYGARVIHHPRNLVSVCGLRCNSSVIVHGEEERALVCEILDLIDSE